MIDISHIAIAYSGSGSSRSCYAFRLSHHHAHRLAQFLQRLSHVPEDSTISGWYLMIPVVVRPVEDDEEVWSEEQDGSLSLLDGQLYVLAFPSRRGKLDVTGILLFEEETYHGTVDVVAEVPSKTIYQLAKITQCCADKQCIATCS